MKTLNVIPLLFIFLYYYYGRNLLSLYPFEVSNSLALSLQMQKILMFLFLNFERTFENYSYKRTQNFKQNKKYIGNIFPIFYFSGVTLIYCPIELVYTFLRLHSNLCKH